MSQVLLLRGLCLNLPHIPKEHCVMTVMAMLSPHQGHSWGSGLRNYISSSPVLIHIHCTLPQGLLRYTQSSEINTNFRVGFYTPWVPGSVITYVNAQPLNDLLLPSCHIFQALVYLYFTSWLLPSPLSISDLMTLAGVLAKAYGSALHSTGNVRK